ncbi:Clan MC, family M14, Zinc carboxypeptidase-like metallopeptidase [Tritrichomonas foetus]|uniref:Clan MC, family M14, Zinc carboxypeptidase-like metallopeptidase n=1 Tax=Tritrichomonas foetus TaxID=1144522 RepID=A0A1J4J715_9EUKA|nr:Clan MC, family M14, Zinc carboxypeptidase-like metallopeptidase [Tritrichomonas foetus]|eukprot:OHS93991.1 Clan MC, family M14, Zinc carboxypeptidase-like metallopeptidase [Tritrichomonas foetus]
MENSSLPEYQCKPLERLEKPITMQLPNNHPAAKMIPCTFKEMCLEDFRDENTLIYDPITPVPAKEGDPIFSGDFECGNLGQVFRIGENKYEIHLLPDPNDQQTAQWFFFKAENLKPGEYFFMIVGFYRQCNLHWKGSQVCSYSEAAARRGIGWQRIGDEMNYFKTKSGKFPEWTWTFKFTVEELDNMFFAHSYPYTFTDQMNCLGKLQPLCRPSTLCQSLGGIDVPVIFWDAEEQKCVDIEPYMKEAREIKNTAPEIRVEEISEFDDFTVQTLRKWGRDNPGEGRKYDRKPVIIIAARTHPGETNSSYAMEGLLQTLFAKNEFGLELRRNFSWLLIPMVNPDGAICGFYRPSLSGNDINRVWKSPDPLMHPIADNVLKLIEVIQKTRPTPFFLDFHGHTAACNSFVYGFMNENNPAIYSAERVFPLLMTKHTPLFSNEMCSYLKQELYEGTMRVVIRRRFHIIFAYTLEMSYGGSDFGTRHDTQFTPHDYRSVGEATARCIADMFLKEGTLASKEVFQLIPPPPQEPINQYQVDDFSTSLSIDGKVLESEQTFFRISPHDLSTENPQSVKLSLNQLVRDVEM